MTRGHPVAYRVQKIFANMRGDVQNLTVIKGALNNSLSGTLAKAKSACVCFNVVKAVGSGPAGPVLAGPIIFKVSNDHIVVTRKLNLFLRKSIKLLPPELLLLAQICTKSFVGWGFAPDPTGGAYSAPQTP